MEPTDVARAFWRYRKRVVVFVGAVSLMTMLAIAFLPKKYGSESKLFVRVGRESVGLDPTATTGETMPIVTTREVELQSVHELLNSTGMLEMVVDQIGAETLLVDSNPNLATRLATQIGEFKRRMTTLVVGQSGLSPEEQQREAAVEYLENNVTVSVAKNSTVITVKARARTPELAQQIASTLVNAYLSKHARIHRTAGSEQFFTEQTERVGLELATTMNRLRDAKNSSAWVTGEGRLALMESQKADIEREQLRTARLLAEAESSFQALNKIMNELDEIVLVEREDRPNAASDAMRQQLYELELLEQEYDTKYRPGHPLLKAVSVQLEEARQTHSDVGEFRGEETYAVNPTRQQIELEYHQEQARVASLQALDASLNVQLAALEERLRTVNTQVLEIETLEREAGILTTAYEEYAANLEQARIDEALEQQQITNVNIAQPATISHQPESPQPVILLALGMLIATGGSAALVFGSERLNQRLRSAEEIEADLSLPVIMTLPRYAGRGQLTPSAMDQDS